MKLHFAFSLLALSASAMANIKIQEELYVPGNHPEIVKDLVDTGSVIIDHVTSEGFELYGSKGLSRYLDQKKIVHLDMKAFNEKVLADYPTSAQIAQALETMARKYPNIMRLTSIGKSVKGKDLLVMKISDNPAADEVEPEFKYISSMHGDEITGRELSMFMIDEIGQKYGKDPEITALVNNTEIYVMPSMNPDGSDMKRRANANGVDLNRNFPDMIRDSQSSPNGREIENQNIMKFQASRQFSLSANFHGGTIVANYPWDSKYDLHPLNDFVKELSLEYAELNPDMRNSDEFPQGVTNGAAWYVVRGGMQDWSYVWHNDLQITIELSHQKWPSYSEIPGFYKNNRDSMIHYIKQIHRGGGFRISRPNVEGVVNIRSSNRDLGNFSFKGSEFYKVMPEGDYVFTVQEKGRSSSQAVNVRVQKDIIPANGNYVQLN